MRVVSRSTVALLIAAAAASAALSHWVIDVVADYVVAHASFDDVASHGSRGLIAGLAIAAALAVAVRAVQRCFDAAANRGPDLTPPSWLSLVPFAATTVLAACCIVPAMECVDARLAGETIAGLSDAFGGSILLGLCTTAICASLVATALFAVVRWLLFYRDRIVAAIASVIRRLHVRPATQQRRRLTSITTCQPRLAAFRRGKRGPPDNAVGSIHIAPPASRGDRCFTYSWQRVASFRDTSKHQPAHR